MIFLVGYVMKIEKPVLKHKNGRIFHTAGVEFKREQQELWFSIDECHADLLTDSCDAFLVSLLLPAMYEGEDIYVKGSVSEKLLYNLSGPLQAVLKVIMPSLSLIRIKADCVISHHSNIAKGVITGFSGGIDSFSVLTNHYYQINANQPKLTHLLFNNVGSHGKGGEKLFFERYNQLLPTAQKIGLPLISVNSNLNQFYHHTLNFRQTHTIRNAAIPLLLQGGIGSFLYASAFHYSDLSIGVSNDMAYTDAITLPLLSTESISSFSVGSEYTRVEKTVQVAQISDSWGALDVCVSSRNKEQYKNCGKCSKCLRTLSTFEIMGEAQRYDKVFDLTAYKKHRKVYFATLLSSSEPLNKEIIKFAKENDFSFPYVSRFLHYTGFGHLKALVKRVRTNLKKRKKKRSM